MMSSLMLIFADKQNVIYDLHFNWNTHVLRMHMVQND